MDEQKIRISQNQITACLQYDRQEFFAAARKEACMFPDAGRLTDEYIQLRQVYQAVFSRIVLARTKLQSLETRLSGRGHMPASRADMDFYQRADQLGLKYLYVRGNARVDRLSEEDLAALRELSSEGKEQNIQPAAEEKAAVMVERTYKKVMAVCPGTPQQYYEPLRTIHGDYRVRGDAVTFVVRSLPQLDEKGELKDEQQEERRVADLAVITPQLKELLGNALGMPVSVVPEIV